jgi:DNA-binding GntR family transcriptional regulator
VSALERAVVGLQRDGLVNVQGDVAVVAPLDIDQLTAMFRVRRKLEAQLLSRSVELMDPRELARLERLIPPDTPIETTESSFGQSIREFTVGMCQPAATQWDLGMMRDIQDSTRRYHCLGYRVVTSAANSVFGPSQRALFRQIERCHELIERFKAGSSSAVLEVVERTMADSELLAQHSFELDYDTELGADPDGRVAALDRTAAFRPPRGPAQTRPKLRLVRSSPARRVEPG